ncbi:MAG: PKD repeat protein, partial [Planctomycetota bacterium]
VGQISGLVILDVSFQEIRAHFLEEDGSLLDEFVLRKSADTTPPRVREAWVPGTELNKVRVVYSEPVLSGSGSSGSELAANYSLGGGATVSGASLLADNRTVELTTSTLTPGQSYVVTATNVREASPGTLTIAANSRVAFMVPAAKSGIAEGETWRYFVGSTAPPGSWMTSSFNDTSWSSGPANFGFGYSGTTFGTPLNSMSGNASTLFLRKTFDVNDASAVNSMILNIDYDDGFIAYLNGVEVERSNAPPTPVHTGLATLSHSAKIFRRFEISKAIPKLVTGTNTLAIVGFNTTVFGNDFVLDPTLILQGDPQAGNQPPLAIYEADANSGNSPVTINFSSSNSSDSDGSVASVLWLFGDGSPAVTTSSASHTYSSPGLYTATLLVTDNDGAQSLAQESIFVHSVGQAPIAVLTANTTTVNAGGSIHFDANSSSDPDGGSVTFAWDFDDPGSGPENFSTAAAPTHVFSTAGTFNVSLTVTDDEGTQVNSMLTINAATGGTPPPTSGGDSGGGGGGGCWTSAPDKNGDSGAPLGLFLCFLAFWTAWISRSGDQSPSEL